MSTIKKKPATTTFHIRLPMKLKRQAQRIAEMNGADLATITRIFYAHIVLRGVVPMPWLTVNGYTPEFEDQLNALAEDEQHIIGPFRSKDALLTSLYAED